MKTIPRKSVVQFLGYLTTYLPELNHTHPDRLLKGWDSFIAQQEQRRTTHEERLTTLESAAVSYVRALGSPFEAGMLEQLKREVDNEVGSTKDLPERPA